MSGQLNPFGSQAQNIVDKLRQISRRSKLAVCVSLDVALSVFGLAGAVYMRVGNLGSADYLVAYPVVAMSTVLCFWACGIYGVVLRFSDASEITRILRAVACASVACLAVMFVLAANPNPRSLWLIYGAFLFVGLACSRLGWIWMSRGFTYSYGGQPVAIYGAGSTGRQGFQFLRAGRHYEPVFWLDDDPQLHGRVISQCRVLNPRAEATRALLAKSGVSTVLMAIPSLEGSDLKGILSNLQELGCVVKTLPSFNQLISKSVSEKDIRSIGLEDLIGRQPVPPDQQLLAENIRGKVVMVTGAGGSVGGELCRQIVQLQPTKLVLFENSEPSLYQIDMTLSESRDAGCELIPVLGSVLDGRKLARVVTDHNVQTLFHAAAYKHVPLVEANVTAGAEVNILGTDLAVKAAFAGGVETFVFISTDKAVRPTSAMGASKRVAELIVQAKANASGRRTKFCIVRFGNVIGSSGSVIPRFQEQIREGGPVTVTHREVNRFFMSIPEAAQLVIQASALARNGDVLLLEMGDPVKIVDVARSLIYLNGLTVKDEENPAGEIEIAITGLRPGEKLYEELLIDASSEVTRHEKIVRAREAFLAEDRIFKMLLQLKEDIESDQPELVRQTIFELAHVSRNSGQQTGKLLKLPFNAALEA